MTDPLTDPLADSQTDPLHVPANPPRGVWVFAVDIPDPAAYNRFFDRFAAGGDPEDWALPRALGVDHLDEDFIEHFPVSTLAPYGGLDRYLVEANGFDDPKVAEDADRLGRVEAVLLVFEQAFGGFEATLNPKPPLSFVGHYRESAAPALKPAPESAAAKGPIADAPTKAPSQAAMSGRVAMIALLVLFALVGLMIWVAG